MKSWSCSSGCGLTIKNKLRSLWGGYFSFRYLNNSSLTNSANYGPVFKFSFQRWQKPTSPLMFEESKYIELFEDADKSKYIASSLISMDVADLNGVIDSYREGYPFTSAYAKFSKILKNKEQYTKNVDGYYLEEVEKCFSALEKYCKVYSACFLMSSFAEEVKLFINRCYVNPKKVSLRYVFNYNTYDNEERMHQDLHVLLDNYKKVLDDLNDFPLWREKFENDVMKLFAFSNTVFDTPEIYKLVDQQKIFK